MDGLGAISVAARGDPRIPQEDHPPIRIVCRARPVVPVATESVTAQVFQSEDKTWYRFRVRVTSEWIRLRIDAKEVVAVDDRKRPVGTRIETRANRLLGFATWETGGALGNIAIRKLTPAEVAATNASAK